MNKRNGVPSTSLLCRYARVHSGAGCVSVEEVKPQVKETGNDVGKRLRRRQGR
ncbi:unnamed protein product [Amoebophrya sp. A25]|nr:unnamed protein product [Amoebophrya sp. A25]|eukprot:GSA25T00000353001.1